MHVSNILKHHILDSRLRACQLSHLLIFLNNNRKEHAKRRFNEPNEEHAQPVI